MKFIADFHTHSHYSIATSKKSIPEYLDYWARIKGIRVIGTGDFIHPCWLEELKDKLEPVEQGLFRLKKTAKIKTNLQISDSINNETRFLLTAEISCIYKKEGKVRKVHNLILAPNFDSVEKIQRQLSRIGNIKSDGRPILGLDSKDLLEIMLNVSDKILFVPAHIWTPWFSVLGAKSGFDRIEDCFGDLSDHIYAIETGLSSDPPMNWMCSFLDKYTLISNSDAHSPEKLGRNANLFYTKLSYNSIIDSIKNGNSDQFLGTIDLYPQIGKYHFDGHKKCDICWNPFDTHEHKGICPICGKPVTIGVLNRVQQLSDRKYQKMDSQRLPYHSIVPLKEILSDIFKVGSNSKFISNEYHRIIEKTGSEFNLLLCLSVDEINKIVGNRIAKYVEQMRERNLNIKEGYDGKFGQINI